MALSNNDSNRATTKGFWTPLRVALTLVVFGLLAALGLSSCNSGGSPDTNTPAKRVTTTSSPGTAPANVPMTNAPAAAAAFITVPEKLRDTKLQTLDGQSVKLSDYANKVMILNIWATWCGPCQMEMPELVKMNNEYKSRGLVVLGLATTYNEHQGIDYVKDFIKAKGINYKIIWDDGTMVGPLVQAVNGHGVIPQSFVISRDGRIIKHFEGFSQYSTPTLMRQAVEDALNGKA